MDKDLPIKIFNICSTFFSKELDLKTFNTYSSSISIKFNYIKINCLSKKEELLIIYDNFPGSNYISVHINDKCVYDTLENINQSIYFCLNNI